MGYSAPKKPFDLKEFLAEKAPPGRRGWRYRPASSAPKPKQPDTKPADPATAEKPK